MDLSEAPIKSVARPLRIGLDLHKFDDIYQGSRTHLLETFSRVVALCPEIRFFCLLQDVAGLLKAYPPFALPNVELVPMRTRSSIARLLLQLPAFQRQLQLDALHMQYLVPVPSFCPTFITLHDVLFESHPQYFTPSFRWRSRLMMRSSALRATHVFTVSAFSREEILARYGLPANKVSVTPNAADGAKFHPGGGGAELIRRRGLEPGRFMLSVGRLEPRKNHRTLLDAYRQLGAGAPPLVLIGQRDFGYAEMLAELNKPDLAGRVKVFEDVTDEELPAFYRHCLAFVYPSFAEGFGMPPLEAMMSGVPVVVGDNTALTEIVGDGGLLVRADDAVALAAAMRRLCDSGELRSATAAKGLKQARQFSWDVAAAEVALRYREIADRRFVGAIS